MALVRSPIFDIVTRKKNSIYKLIFSKSDFFPYKPVQLHVKRAGRELLSAQLLIMKPLASLA